MAGKKITDPSITKATSLVGTEVLPFSAADGLSGGSISTRLMKSFSNNFSAITASTTLDAGAAGCTFIDVDLDASAPHTITLPLLSTVNIGDTIFIKNAIADNQTNIAAQGSDACIDASMVAFSAIPSQGYFSISCFDLGGGKIWIAIALSEPLVIPPHFDYSDGALSDATHGKILVSQVSPGGTATITFNKPVTGYQTLFLNPARNVVSFAASGWTPSFGWPVADTRATHIVCSASPVGVLVFAISDAAAHVADADATSLATLASSVDALRDALIAAGHMRAS